MRHESLRVARLFCGLFLYAVGIVLTVHANLGVAPWDVFHQGASRLLGITFGMTSILTSLAIIAAVALMKENIGIGTLSNTIIVGAFVDVLMLGRMIPEAQTFIPGLAMMIAGLFVIGLATFFYIGAGYGSGPRDSLMVIMKRRTGMPVGFCRAIIEGAVLICGWLLGGHAGIGTVIFVLGIGLAVQIVFKLFKFDVASVRQETFMETWARMKTSRKA